MGDESEVNRLDYPENEAVPQPTNETVTQPAQPPQPAQPTGAPKEYSVRFRGPDLDSPLAITEAADLDIVEAFLAKIRRKVSSSEEKSL